MLAREENKIQKVLYYATSAYSNYFVTEKELVYGIYQIAGSDIRTVARVKNLLLQLGYIKEEHLGKYRVNRNKIMKLCK